MNYKLKITALFIALRLHYNNYQLNEWSLFNLEAIVTDLDALAVV